MFFDKSEPKFPIGIDITNGSVKLVQLEKSHNKTLIKAFTSIPLPKGVLSNEVVTDFKTLDYLLQQGLEKPKYGRFSGKRVVASLPETKSFVRVIHMPHMPDSQIDSSVPFEAESYIPIPIEQVYLDWQHLSETNGRMEILLIATPKESADKFLEVLDKLKLTPQALEVESQSVQRALVKSGETPTFLITDISESKTNLVMIDQGKLYLTSSIPIGGTQFTNAISKALAIPLEKAESIKQEVGLNNSAQYPNLKLSLLPVVTNLAAEIKNVIQFQTEHTQTKTTEVLICGGASKLKNFDENLGYEFSELGITVSQGNPLVNIDSTDKPAMTQVDALEYTTALGLALRTEY